MMGVENKAAAMGGKMSELNDLYKDKSKATDLVRRWMIDLNYSRSQMAKDIGITLRSLNLLLDGSHDKLTDKVFNRIVSYLGYHNQHYWENNAD